MGACINEKPPANVHNKHQIRWLFPICFVLRYSLFLLFFLYKEIILNKLFRIGPCLLFCWKHLPNSTVFKTNQNLCTFQRKIKQARSILLSWAIKNKAGKKDKRESRMWWWLLWLKPIWFSDKAFFWAFLKCSTGWPRAHKYMMQHT